MQAALKKHIMSLSFLSLSFLSACGPDRAAQEAATLKEQQIQREPRVNDPRVQELKNKTGEKLPVFRLRLSTGFLLELEIQDSWTATTRSIDPSRTYVYNFGLRKIFAREQHVQGETVFTQHVVGRGSNRGGRRHSSSTSYITNIDYASAALTNFSPSDTAALTPAFCMAVYERFSGLPGFDYKDILLSNDTRAPNAISIYLADVVKLRYFLKGACGQVAIPSNGEGIVSNPVQHFGELDLPYVPESFLDVKKQACLEVIGGKRDSDAIRWYNRSCSSLGHPAIH